MAGYSLGLTGAVYDYYQAHAFREPTILAELLAGADLAVRTKQMVSVLAHRFCLRALSQPTPSRP